MKQTIGKTEITAEGLEIRVERYFEAPRDRVFAAWTTADHLMGWWGTTEYPTTYCTVDFRVGGRWHYCMTGPEGAQSWGLSLYQAITVPERIVYTDVFSNAEGTIDEAMPSFSIRVDFVEEGSGTRVISISQVGSADELNQLIAMGMVQGVAETWDRLDAYLGQPSTTTNIP